MFQPLQHKGVASRHLFACLFAIYTINVFGKVAFSAVTVELVGLGVMTKTEAGLVSAAFWLAYALGQFGGGVLANKISPYRLLSITFFGSFLANLLIAFFDSFLPMLLIWTANGLIQFGLWPSILRIISNEMLPTHRGKALGRLGYCYAFGSILSYLLTSVILLFLPWQAMFLCCAMVNLASVPVVWVMKKRYAPLLARASGREEPEEIPKQPKGRLTPSVWLGGGVLLFALMVLIRTVTDGCIKTWLPTILSETYGVSSSFTLFLTVVLLAVNVAGVVLCSLLYKKLRRDEAKTVLVMVGLSLPMTAALLWFERSPLALVVVLMIGITMLLYASDQVLTMHYPGQFHSMGLTASVGGILSGVSAFSGVLSSWGGGFIADHFGWNTLILFWVILLAVFVLIAAVAVPIWKRFKENNL